VLDDVVAVTLDPSRRRGSLCLDLMLDKTRVVVIQPVRMDQRLAGSGETTSTKEQQDQA
jgi:hypothetical protein